jgi:hypothetical protein
MPDRNAPSTLEFQRQPRVFAVVSWGAAATTWLASALNDCPDILCLHAGNHMWSRLSGASLVDGLPYIQILARLGHTAKAAGDVHGIARNQIRPIQEHYGDAFRCAVLVRDPLPRLMSHLALASQYPEPRRIYGDLSYLNDRFPTIVKQLPGGDYQGLIFLHAANLLNAIVDEVSVGPIWRMEDLTSNPTGLIGAADYLTSNSVAAPTDWARKWTEGRKLNRHAATAIDFNSWQRRVLASAVHPDAVAAYRAIGYDMSWIATL